MQTVSFFLVRGRIGQRKIDALQCLGIWFFENWVVTSKSFLTIRDKSFEGTVILVFSVETYTGSG